MSQASHQGGATGVAAPPVAAITTTTAPATTTPATMPARPGPATTSAAAPAPAVKTRDTPRRLRLLSLGVVIAGVVVALLGALTFSYLAFSLSRAQADTAQLIRVQKIQSNLLSADATATNAFLVGGLEPPAQRAVYDQALSSTSSLIVEASQAQPADAAALSALNQQVISYAATIEQARANNRQGLPVGAQYLRNASAELRSTALPILDNLVSSNAARAADEMDARIGYVIPVISLLALVVLIVGQIWLARRFRRTINVGMLAGAAALFVITVGGLIAVQQLSSSLSSISNGSLAAVNTAADARIDANNAKSNESLTLIARGSGQAFEDAWKSSADSVARQYPAPHRPARAGESMAGLHRCSQLRYVPSTTAADGKGQCPWPQAPAPSRPTPFSARSTVIWPATSTRLARTLPAHWRTNSRSCSLPPSSPSSAGWRLRSSAVGALALG